MHAASQVPHTHRELNSPQSKKICQSLTTHMEGSFKFLKRQLLWALPNDALIARFADSRDVAGTWTCMQPLTRSL